MLCPSYNGLFVLRLAHTGRRIRHLFHRACFEDISSGYILTLPVKGEAYPGELHRIGMAENYVRLLLCGMKVKDDKTSFQSNY